MACLTYVQNKLMLQYMFFKTFHNELLTNLLEWLQNKYSKSRLTFIKRRKLNKFSTWNICLVTIQASSGKVYLDVIKCCWLINAIVPFAI